MPFFIQGGNMNIFQIICTILFIGVSITHLVFIFLDKEKARMITKGFIVFTLILFALASSNIEPLIYIGLCCSLFGDLLLLLKSKKIYFVIGACGFSITHIINFILVSRYLPERLNWLYFAIVLLAGYLIVELIRPLIKKTMKKMSYPSLAYLYIVFALIVNIFIAFISTHNYLFLIMLFGGMCFLTSDILLTIYTFVKKFKYGNFILMLFYCLGQSLIYIPLIILLK